MDISVKKYFFKTVLYSLLLVVNPVMATPNPDGGLRMHNDYEGWRKILPTQVKVQYAGGMGVLSAGVGWDYGKRNQWESDIMLGYLPRMYSDTAHATFTYRQTFTPWCKPLGGRFWFEPLSCGLYLNTISGDEFWIKEPCKYGGGYYDFAPGVRTHLFVGQRINYKALSQGTLHNVSLYYEFSICDLNLISKVTNHRLKLSDIVFFSAGLRFVIIKP